VGQNVTKTTSVARGFASEPTKRLYNASQIHSWLLNKPLVDRDVKRKVMEVMRVEGGSSVGVI